MNRKKIITAVLILTSWTATFGQNLIETSKDKSNLKMQTFNNRMAVTDFLPININLDALNNKKGKIKFWEIDEEIQQTKLDVRSLKNYSWFGSNLEKTTSVIISVSDNDIQGIVTYNTELFRIETIDNKYYLTKIDQNKYPKEECGVHSIQKQEDRDTNSVSPYNDTNDNYGFNKMISGEPFTCRLRLLVLYTPAAKNAVSDISNTIQLAVDEMKLSFINSNVNREIELVFVGETNYVESGLSYSGSDNDLTRFSGTSDGHMDEVHNLREKHQADICILVYDDQSLCGIARGIKVSTGNAFCLVNYDCATGNYSFAHEIAHLIGCQHHTNDPTHSGAASAYPFAHGYKSPNNDWRTIMAYSCTGGCPRLLFWSNPNINFGGVPMGTTNSHNNTRMLNEKIPNAMSFLQPTNNLIIQNSDISNSLGGDIIAKNKIETSGVVTIQSGQEYSFRSGGEIILEPGFTAEAGSNFVAEIVEVNDCGQPDGENSDYGVATDEPQYLTDESKKIFLDFIVYPNPTENTIQVSFNVENQGNIKITVFDYTGRKVKDLGVHTVSNGSFNKEFNLSELQSNIYFIVLSFEDKKILVQKIVKK
jgi:hypothetical protein